MSEADDRRPWALVQFRDIDGSTWIGVRDVDVAPEKTAPVERIPEFDGMSMLDLLSAWAEVEPILRTGRPAGGPIVPDAVLLAPITYPAKVLCCGANYHDHLEEMGLQPPDGPVDPFLFMKPPTTAVVGTGDAIELPTGMLVDWEAELGVVIGRRCAQVAASEAAGYIAGYVVANDVSARNRLVRANPIAPPFMFEWVAAKAFDGSCPIGPNLVPAWLVPDPQDTRIRLCVNGRTRQDASTSGMITPILDIVAAASTRMTLEPGDVILTGTPAGVGHPSQTYLAPGDEVHIVVDGVGDLRNRFVAASRPIG